MDKQQELTVAGDGMREVLGQAVAALMDGDIDRVWNLLDVTSWEATRRWDAANDQQVLSDEQLARDKQKLADVLRSSLPKP